MKIVCVCGAGYSRSVGAAFLLKQMYNYDAIACGAFKNSPETLTMLFDWADKIAVMDETLLQNFPEGYKNKMLNWDVGADRYFHGFDKDLTDQCLQYIDRDLKHPIDFCTGCCDEGECRELDTICRDCQQCVDNWKEFHKET